MVCEVLELAASAEVGYDCYSILRAIAEMLIRLEAMHTQVACDDCWLKAAQAGGIRYQH
jgi:hypothetical protein